MKTTSHTMADLKKAVNHIDLSAEMAFSKIDAFAKLVHGAVMNPGTMDQEAVSVVLEHLSYIAQSTMDEINIVANEINGITEGAAA